MYRLTILYETPTDPQHFRDYYYRHHIPVARRMNNLTSWNLSWIDQDSSKPSPYILVAELYATSKQAMDNMLASSEGQAARNDLDNFATGRVHFLAGEEEEVTL